MMPVLPALSLLGRVPRWVWIASAGALVLGVGACVHDRKIDALVEQTRKEAIADRDREWQGAFDKMQAAAKQWRTNYETKAAALSAEIGKRHAQDIAANRARSDDLLLHGPGRAAAPRCGPAGGAQLSTPASGRERTSAEPDAPLAPVPSDEPLAIVPWGDLVRRAREHDDLLAEVKSWRTHYIEHKRLHDDAVAKLAEIKPEFGRAESP